LGAAHDDMYNAVPSVPSARFCHCTISVMVSSMLAPVCSRWSAIPVEAMAVTRTGLANDKHAQQ